MKKLIALLLTVAMCVSLCACEGAKGDNSVVSEFPEKSEATSAGNAQTESIKPEETQKAQEDQKAEEPEVPAERQVLKIGETAKTDLVEFTMKECKFTDKVGLESSCWLMPHKAAGGLSAGDGKVYVWYSFEVKNIGKEKVSGYDVCNVEVDYNDGYRYKDSVFSWGYNWSTASWLSKNVGLASIEPLGTQEYYGFTKCVDAVKTGRDAQLLLIATLPSTEGEMEVAFAYTAEGTDTSESALAISDAFNTAIEELSFVAQYAGNTNNQGSRKFADTKIESVKNSLNGIDVAYINENLPETAGQLPKIQENIVKVCDLLVEMGRTNSDKDVNTIKQTARDTMALLEKLLETELSAFN